MVRRELNWWSTLTSYLSLKSSRRGSESKLLAVPGSVGSGRPASTERANEVIALDGITPSGYDSPVSGLTIGLPRMPCRCAIVGMVAKVTVLEICRNPS